MKIKKLGDFLKERQLVEEDEIIEAVHLAKQNGKKLGQVLLDIGALTEDDLLKAIGDQLGFNIVSLANYPIDPKVVALISREICEEKLCVPLKFDDNNSLHVAMKDVSNAELVQYLKFSTGKNIIPSIALESEIRNTIGRLYDFAASLEDLVSNVSKLTELELVDPEREADASEARSFTVTQIVKSVLSEAVAKGASDIHMEPSQAFLRVRIRIDGQLNNLINIPKWVQAQVIGCIKVQASLNIAEKRQPQDGKLSANVAGRHVDFRVSTLPTPQGEKVVIRIQDKGNKGYSLSSLNLPPYLLKQILRLLQNDKGIILVTGPTGSGKTTLLYSMLTELARRGPNIITVEDPIEYEFEGITQTQINEKAGMTFSSILRSILRQDPNVIMIGEIRDQETAEIAFRAAQTGHLVLSTLHTNSAVSVVTRLKDLGVEPFLMASTVLGIFAQRLVRCNCPQCVGADDASHIADPAQRKLLELLPEDTVLKRGEGCEACGDSGYKGRTGVYEYLRFSPGVVDAVNAGLPEKQILQAAKADGMKTLVDECVRLISEGTTSFAECSGILATLDMAEIAGDPHAHHHCPSCNKTVAAEFVVCPYCQYRLVCKCPKCEAQVERDWQVCPYCSEPLGMPTQAPMVQAPPTEAPIAPSKPLVLVVDEKDAMRRALNIILSQIGCEVVESTNGQEALDVAGNILPNLIIADFDTPRINGSKLFRTLRENASTSMIPFIMLTQGSSHDTELAEILEDVDGHLSKPFNYRELQAKVKKLVATDTAATAAQGKPANLQSTAPSPTAPATSPATSETQAVTPLPAAQPAPATAKPAPKAASQPVAKVTPPSAPAGLSAAPAKSQVALSFATPPDDAAAPTGYMVVITPARTAAITLDLVATEGAQAAKGRVGATLSAQAGTTIVTITGLINGKTHDFSVAARNAAGISAATAVKATPAGVPEAPAIGDVTLSEGQANISFAAPASHGGSFISGYTVISNPPGGVDRDAGLTCLSHTVTGLVGGETYTFSVVASNAIGNSPPSASSQSVTLLMAPRRLGLVAIAGNAKVHLLFPTPADRGCLPERYQLSISPEGRESILLALDAIPSASAMGNGLTVALAVSGGKSAFTVGGLSNGKTYTFSVTATNRAGASTPSPAVSATPASVPSAPAIASVTVGNGQAVVALAAPSSDGGSPVTGYTVISTPAGGVDQDAGSANLSHTVTGLDPATSYTFTAVAANGVGNGVPSGASPAVVPTLPPSIAKVLATPGKFRVALTFATPTGAPVLSYEVSVTPARAAPVRLALKAENGATATEGGMTATLARGSNGTRITVSGLVNGKVHDFNIIATNSTGKGQPSASVRAIPATVPGAPAITAVNAGDGQASVEFAAPTSQGGNFITGYTVLSDPPGGNDADAGSTRLTHTLSGLRNGMTYTFTVYASNGMGNGAPSAPSQRVIPCAPAAAREMDEQPRESLLIDNDISWLDALESGGMEQGLQERRRA